MTQFTDALQEAKEEDMIWEAALEGSQIQGAMNMLNLQLGVPHQAATAAALEIYHYARRHQSDLPEYADDIIIAAQQSRYVGY